MIIESFFKSHFPYKSVNFYFMVVIIKDTLTDLCENLLSQNDVINTFYEKIAVPLGGAGVPRAPRPHMPAAPFGGGRCYWGTSLASEVCSGSEAGPYLRLIDFVYHSTLGLRVIKKKKKTVGRPQVTQHLQRYLAHTKTYPPKTLQWQYAQGPMVALEGEAVSYERGTPVTPAPPRRFL